MVLNMKLEIHHFKITIFPFIIYKRTLQTHHHIFGLFLQTIYAIEKLSNMIIASSFKHGQLAEDSE